MVQSHCEPKLHACSASNTVRTLEDDKVFLAGVLPTRETRAPCNKELILNEESVTASKLRVEGQNTQLHAPPSVQLSPLGPRARALAQSLGMTTGPSPGNL